MLHASSHVAVELALQVNLDFEKRWGGVVMGRWIRGPAVLHCMHRRLLTRNRDTDLFILTGSRDGTEKRPV